MKIISNKNRHTMKTISKFLIILTIGFLLISCEKSETETTQVRFELESTEYKKGDTIRAYFINEKDHEIYRVRPSETCTWLEKLNEKNWIALLLHPEHDHLPVVQYHKVKSGESVLIEYPYIRLEQMIDDTNGVYDTEGIYRFSETISITPDEQSDHKKVVSRKFTIK